MESDGSFLMHDGKRKKKRRRNGNQKLSLWKSENTYNHPFSRVRVRACYRSFCLFAVTSVTGLEVRC